MFSLKLVRFLKRRFESCFFSKAKVKSYGVFEHREQILNDMAINDEGPSLIKDGGNILISLTTYSYRIYDVHLVIESLGLQSLKASKIVLWLDQNEYNEDTIPIVLKNQIKRGLTIRFCENLKSYKKLVPTILEYPNFDVITVDDDYIYPFDMVEVLYQTSLSHPSCIVTNFAHVIKYKNDSIDSYKNWDLYTECDKPGFDIFPVGAGGIYYPARSLHELVTENRLFQSLAPNADDVWFKFMSIANNVLCVKTSSRFNYRSKFILIERNQHMGLYLSNLDGNENDEQVSRVTEYLKEHGYRCLP
ncbi:glycosyl transferase [Vibrio vulnificus]|uniref:glycosyl transferase n=1 Tax=Vibrio vulnificus TaxID=672 RepID=UPI0010291B55|nr:glycosyl transferase [Vibrio vulnificus]EGR0130527.1 glycosyl transferase [Vibrio vulnificus]RZP70930.1 glycosyl transferase [Vibrio vulnificus]HAS6198950.1 glycosyl transferase [Vibrio vulnificus]HAS8303877.1 glycosyl transferase [Vibrio vulnificus]